MKKIFILAFVLLVGVFPVKALYLVPGTGSNKTSNVEENIDVFAAPATPTDSMALIRLHFANISVVSWTDNAAMLSVGDCTGGSKFLTNDVCVLTAPTVGLLENGILLGTVRVRWGSLGAATITKTSGNGYYNGTTFTEQLGVAGTYTITTGEIPPTALELPINNELMFSIAGLALIFIGAGLKIYLNDSKRQARY